MRTKVGLSKEFKAELLRAYGKRYRHNVLGTAILLKGVGYVFVDHVAMGLRCLYAHCPDDCPYGSDCPYVPLIATCIQQISRVTVHELVHLCGALSGSEEDQASRIEKELLDEPFLPYYRRDCPKLGWLLRKEEGVNEIRLRV